MASNKDNRNLFQRLTGLFRSGPAIRRKIRTSDTVMAVPDKAKSSGVLLFQKSLSPTYASVTGNAYNLSERLARYQDFVEMEYCLHGSTQIPVLDGFISIAELAKRCDEDSNYSFIVYAYDHNKKEIVPAWAKQARKTQRCESFKVTFDNGKFIIGSPNHRLMLRDGSYKRIDELLPGEAMMPFHRKDLFSKDENSAGYRWIYTMSKNGTRNGWKREHTLIAEWVLERNLEQDEVVHHKNFIKHDNRPENLQVMTQSDHGKLHALIINGVRWAPENSEWIQKFQKNHSTWMRDNNPSTRYDVTFGRILETCERVGFDQNAVCEELDATISLVVSRLAQNGFANFTTFAKAYAQGKQPVLSVTGKLGINDLSLDLISSHIKDDDTKQSLCIKLGCTTNVFNKFLCTRLSKSWLKLREDFGFVNTKNALVGRPRGSYKYDVTFKQICDAYKPGMSRKDVAKKLGVNWNVVLQRVNAEGYKRFNDWSKSYENTKVVSVEPYAVEDLYDLTVDGYKNFCTDSVVSHNTPEIAAAMDIYADETVATDEKGRMLHVHSPNPKIQSILENLFYDTLNFEFNGRLWARNLVKYGDFFTYVDVSPQYGVQNVFPIPVNEIEREENYDRDDPFAIRFRWVSMANRVLQNWEIMHFRLLGNDMFLPYGSSIIEPARRIWRQLILIEDAMLVYRIVRAPERRVFYLDVGNTPAAEVPLAVEELKKNMRTNQVIDRTSGRVDLRYNPLCNSLKTLINIQDGRVIPLSEIIKEWEGGKRDHWVYSIDLENKRIVPGKVTWAGVTRKDAEIIRVHIDDGKWFDVTPDHRFMLRNGTYVQASELKTGDALMPLYRQLSSKDVDGHKITGYEKTYNPFTQEYVFTHRNNVIATQGFDSIKGKIVHHIDFDKRNNSPENLRPMEWSDHMKLHGDEVIKYNRSPVGRKNSSRRMKKTWAEGKIAPQTFVDLWNKPDVRKKRVNALTLNCGNNFIEHCFRVLDKLGTGLSTREATFIDALNADETLISELKLLNPKFHNGFNDRFTRISLQTRLKQHGMSKSLESLKRAWLLSRFNVDDIKAFCSSTPDCTRSAVLKQFNMTRTNFEELVRLTGNDLQKFRETVLPGNARYTRQKSVGYLNHKVSHVEILMHKEDVGCITVEKFENFFSAGSSDCYGDLNSADFDAFSFVNLHNCLSPNTRVPLLDGRTITIKELEKEWNEGQRDQETYSLDLENGGRLVPGKVIWSGVSGRTRQYVKMTLDDGATIKVTPDHKMMLRSGDPIKASELKINDSLMPLSVRYSGISTGITSDVSDRRAYEQIVNPENGGWYYTHRLIATAKYGLDIYNNGQVSQQGNIIHHKNFDKRNNSSNNLELMKNEDHARLHSELGAKNIIKYNKSEQKRLKTSELNKFYKKAEHMGDVYNHSDLHSSHNVIRSKVMTNWWADKNNREAVTARMSYKWSSDCQEYVINKIRTLDKFEGLEAFLRRLQSDDQFMSIYDQVNTHLTCDHKKSVRKKIVGNFIKQEYANWKSVWAAHHPSALGRRFINNFDASVQFPEGYHNHKIAKIEFIDVDEDVYNITIDKYHNLAIQGNDVDDPTKGKVQLFQSVDEDYWVPVRGQNTATKIDTLAGGQNTATVEDVAYIQRKLFAALKIPKAYLGFDDMLCLQEDQRIPLLDGSNPTIKELADRPDAADLKDAWVYSTDEAGNIKPGRVLSARATKQVTELYHVTLDNGEVVKCTGNHPFLCRDGLYRRADELISGQSLMPIHRKLSSRADHDFQDGYEKVWDNVNERWEYTHRLISTSVPIEKDESLKTEGSWVIHHIDHDKRNNTPSNLIRMGKKAHAIYHARHAQNNLLTEASRNKLRAVMKTDAYKKKHLKGVHDAWLRDDGSRSRSISLSNVKLKRSKITIEQLEELARVSISTSDFADKVTQCFGVTFYAVNNIIKRAGFGVKSWLKQHVGRPPGCTLDELIDFCNKNDIKSYNVFRKHPMPAGSPVNPKQIRELLVSNGYNHWGPFARENLTFNHKVVSVEVILQLNPVWVYDIEVENYHNFLLNQGVVVHNSSKATLSQLDIRFSRTISVIQKTIVAELNKLAMIHLFAHGFDGEELMNFTLKLSNPSTVAQQQKLELIRARFEIAGTAPEGIVDKQYIRREVLNLTDEHIEKIEGLRLKERVADAKIESAGEAPEGGGGGGGGGGSDLFGDEGGAGGAGAEEPATGGAEPAGGGGGEEDLTAGEDPEDDELEEPGVQLLTSADDDLTDHIGLSLKDGETPVSASPQLDKHLYNRGRRRTHGASKTHMPDFKRMTGIDTPGAKDPYDKDWAKSMVSNPLGEAAVEPQPRTPLPRDIMTMLGKMGAQLGIKRASHGILTEDVDISESDDVLIGDQGDKWIDDDDDDDGEVK